MWDKTHLSRAVGPTAAALALLALPSVADAQCAPLKIEFWPPECVEAAPLPGPQPLQSQTDAATVFPDWLERLTDPVFGDGFADSASWPGFAPDDGGDLDFDLGLDTPWQEEDA